MYRHLHSKRCSCINGYDVEASDGSRKIIKKTTLTQGQDHITDIIFIASHMCEHACLLVTFSKDGLDREGD